MSMEHKVPRIPYFAHFTKHKHTNVHTPEERQRAVDGRIRVRRDKHIPAIYRNFRASLVRLLFIATPISESCHTLLQIITFTDLRCAQAFALSLSVSRSRSAAWPCQPNAPTYNSPQCVPFSVHIVCTHEICLAHTLSSSKTRHTRQSLPRSGTIRGSAAAVVVSLLSFQFT